jgi:small multidrug resistance family-3 protein
VSGPTGAATFLVYIGAAFAEIGGCFAFWAWARLGRSSLWLAPGALSLFAFAFLLTRVETDAAGRAYAAYGGVYIAASLLWLWLGRRRRGDLSRGRGVDPPRPACWIV